MPDEPRSKKIAEALEFATETAQFWRDMKQPTEMTHVLRALWSITTALTAIAYELALTREQRGEAHHAG
jgi:hypothetical protein